MYDYSDSDSDYGMEEVVIGSKKRQHANAASDTMPIAADAMEEDTEMAAVAESSSSDAEDEGQEPEPVWTTDDQLDITEQKLISSPELLYDRYYHIQYVYLCRGSYLFWLRRLTAQSQQTIDEDDAQAVADAEEARTNTLKYFERTRKARYYLSSSVAMLGEYNWLQWLNEEQFMWMVFVSGSDDPQAQILRSTGIKALSSIELKSLFGKAVSDSPVPAIWVNFCEFMITAAGLLQARTEMADDDENDNTEEVAAFGSTALRDIFESAVGSCGYHMSECHVLWNLYREWAESSELFDENAVRELWRRYLYVPHFALDHTWASYQQWEDEHESERTEELYPVYETSVKAIKDRVDYELAVDEANYPKEGKAPGLTRRQNAWLKYLEFEIASNSTTPLVVQLFERGLYECVKSDALWSKYIFFLEDRYGTQGNETTITKEVLLSACDRAAKCCHYKISIWLSYLINLEFLGSDVNTVYATYNLALRMGNMKKAVEYEDLALAYLGFLRRSYEAQRENQYLAQTLRDSLYSISEHLIEKFPDHTIGDSGVCPVYRLWATVEAEVFGDLERAREVYRNYILAYHSKNSKVWIHYAQFEHLYSRDVQQARQAYASGMYALDSATYLYFLAMAWLDFERMHSNHVNYVHYAGKLLQERLADVQAKKKDEAQVAQQGKGKPVAKGKKQDAQVDKKSKKYQQNGYDKKQKQTKAAKPVGRQYQSKGEYDTSAGTAETTSIDGAAQPAGPASISTRKRYREEAPADAAQDSPQIQYGDEDGAPSGKKYKTQHEEDEALARERLTLFVWNLYYGVSQEALKEAFENKECKVNSVRIVRDHQTGKSKGFAYVEMVDAASVSKGLQLDNVKMNGRLMRVSISNPPKSKEDRDRQHEESMRERYARKERNYKPYAQEQKVQPAAETAAPTAPEQYPTMRKPKLLMVPRSVMIKAKPAASAPAQLVESAPATDEYPKSNADFKAFLLRK